MFTKHKIIIGDSREMKEVDNESVHLIITSLYFIVFYLLKVDIYYEIIYLELLIYFFFSLQLVYLDYFIINFFCFNFF